MGFPRFSKRKNLRPAVCTGVKRLQAEPGRALVELAASVALFTLILLGATGQGNVLHDSIAVSDAAKAGVQYGTRNPSADADTQGIQNAAAADAPNLTLTTTSSLSCICSDGSASTCLPTDCSGASIETILEVQTQATVTPLVRLPGFPSTITLHGQAIQKVIPSNQKATL